MRQALFQRLVGLLILGTVLVGAGLLVAAIVFNPPAEAEARFRRRAVGVWQIMYDTELPATSVMLAAVGLALLFAAGVAIIERRISNETRRSLAAQQLPLSPRVVMAETRGEYAGPVRVTVLIPAHNEEDCITATLESLLRQSHVPHRIVVVADNCSDRTVELSRAMGVGVFETVDNKHKKAGGLNQALKELLPPMGDNDVVMVMDADTTLDDGFLEHAVARLTNDRGLMAVGGLFYGEDGKGLIGQFQRNEYVRYSRDLKRRRGRVFVLTGTASLFRARAMRTVAAERGRLLPGVPGDVYDTVALTEDNELTLALKCLGALIVSPHQCTVVTEVMPGWRALWAQRLRWQRGAVDNLGAYGMRPQTMRYWAQQLGIGYGVIALSGYLALILLMMVSMDEWVWFPFWLGIGGLFALERLITVWKGGWGARLLAVTLFPELFYAMFLNVVYVKGIVDISLGRSADWKHVVGGQVQQESA